MSTRQDASEKGGGKVVPILAAAVVAAAAVGGYFAFAGEGAKPLFADVGAPPTVDWDDEVTLFPAVDGVMPPQPSRTCSMQAIFHASDDTTPPELLTYQVQLANFQNITPPFPTVSSTSYIQNGVLYIKVFTAVNNTGQISSNSTFDILVSVTEDNGVDPPQTGYSTMIVDALP